MPATSAAQRQVMAIAEHHPGQLYKRNRGLLRMTKEQLHDFAATRQKNLPKRKGLTVPLSHALRAKRRA